MLQSNQQPVGTSSTSTSTIHPSTGTQPSTSTFSSQPSTNTSPSTSLQNNYVSSYQAFIQSSKNPIASSPGNANAYTTDWVSGRSTKNPSVRADFKVFDLKWKGEYAVVTVRNNGTKIADTVIINDSYSGFETKLSNFSVGETYIYSYHCGSVSANWGSPIFSRVGFTIIYHDSNGNLVQSYRELAYYISSKDVVS